MTQPTKTKKVETKATTRTVALRINPSSHIDRADLPEGVVTKTQVLIVPSAVAKILLERHRYLTKAED